MKKLFLLAMSSITFVCLASEKNKISHKVEILSVVNKKNFQEDFFYHGKIDDGELAGGTVYAVFDGHGGPFAARLLKQKLHTFLSTARGSSMSEKMKTAFKKCDEYMINHFQEEEKKDPMSHYSRCGSTAVVVCIKDGIAYFGNVGDSRALLIEGNKIGATTIDHKVDNPDELERMQKAGAHAYLNISPFTAITSRICGLAMSRAFGDYRLKENLTKKCGSSVVIAEPEYMEKTLTPENKFLVLASDGLWDVLSNEDVIQILHEKKDHDIQNLTHFLVSAAINRGSMDNITVMLVDLLP